MSSRRLDIGIASFQSPQALDRTIAGIRATCRMPEWRCLVIDNASPDPAVQAVIAQHAAEDQRVIAVLLDRNTGYAGAVNTLFELTAEAKHVAYFDNDCQPLTHGWDTEMADMLDAHHELGMLFPATYVHFPIPREHYTEILWGVGCAWILNRTRALDVWTETERFFDPAIGHHEEVDFQLRLRLAGWKIAAHPAVHVRHEEHASRSPESQARINAGVQRWVDKWEGRFGGKRQNYHSSNVLRFELWPPVALYMEEIFKQALPGLNDNPETVSIHGREYDLIKVPRPKGFYRGRAV